MGLPYLLIGAFSGLITQLPKAGTWLKWVERAFGVVVFAFGLFYLALALHIQLPGVKSVIDWQPYSIEKVQAAARQHKPTVIDFYADWCLACHELDQMVFSKADVIEPLSHVNTLRVDATDMDDPKVEAIIERYGIIGLPTVVFLDSDGYEIKKARIEGAAKLSRFLKSVALLK